MLISSTSKKLLLYPDPTAAVKAAPAAVSSVYYVNFKGIPNIFSRKDLIIPFLRIAFPEPTSCIGVILDLVYHTYEMTEFEKAFKTIKTKPHLKVMFDCNC